MPEASTPVIQRTAIAIAALSVVLMFLCETLWVANLSGDEASHVIMGENITRDLDYYARPSITPQGDLDEKRNVVAFPPGDPLLRAVAMKLVGNALLGSALITALAWAATLFFLHRLATWLSPSSAPWTVILAACSPGMFWLFGWQEAEPTLTAVGLGGTALLVTGYRDQGLLRALAGGVLIGFAFVIKLYLIAPFLAVVGVYVLARMIATRRICRFDFQYAALASLGFVIAGGSHLLVVWQLAPHELTFWIERVYFAPFFTDDTTIASKFSGSVRNPEHNHPSWYYFAVLYREHYILMPILFGALLGFRQHWRCWLRPEALAIAAGISVILLWSIPATKEPLYIIPSAALIYLFGGWALSSFMSTSQRSPHRLWIIAFTVILAVAIFAAYLAGVKDDDITLKFTLLHTLAAIITVTTLTLAPLRRQRLLPVAMTVLLLGTHVAIYALFPGPSDNRKLAAAMVEALADSEVRDISFMADDLNEPQLRLQRTALMWKDLSDEELADPAALLAEDGKLGKVRAFIITPELRADPRYAALLKAVMNITVYSRDHSRLLLRQEYPGRG